MNIIFVGLAGVPYGGRACDPRLSNIAKLLSSNGKVTIVNRYSSQRMNSLKGNEIPDVEIVEILKRRDTGRKVTLFFYLLSILFEPFVLYRLHRKNRIDYLHMYTGHYVDFILYRLFANLIKASVVYEYVEYRSSKGYHGLYHKVNNYLCDFHGAKLWDACFAISNYLSNMAKTVNPSLPIMKITPLCDSDKFNENTLEIDMDTPYIMFCGSAVYFEIIQLIIDSFKSSSINRRKSLLLVLSGSKDDIQRVKRYYPECIILNRLGYEQLIAYYKHAYALMIPIRESIEDIARFPNKICEYLAAGGLIITTNKGESPYYFNDGINAIVADECTVESIKEKLDKLESGYYDLNKIRSNAYKTGLEHFSISAYKESVINFLETCKRY